jgi:large subunit ribosomal protein L28
MARRCMITGKGVLVGQNVSHANNKSKRRFLPNVQTVSLVSDALGRPVQIRVSTNGLRNIEKAGGLDAWLAGASNADLALKLRRIKRQVVAAQTRKAA